MPRDRSLARDAALRRLRRANRWLIAGSVALSALLTDVAAQAFPGRTISRSAHPSSTAQTRHRPASPARAHADHRSRTHHAVPRALKPPAQAPAPTTATSESAPASPAPAPAPAPTSPPASTPAPAPAPSPAPAAAAPAPAPAPVVSGGS
jgi:hypothetical protein